MCIGGHETSMWPCCISKPVSCGRICERRLICGNHVCQKECHSVNNQQSLDQDAACAKCNEGCQRKRPQGCTHPCKDPCHLAPCKLCYVALKSACHCGLTQIYYQCNDIYNIENGDDRNKLEASKNRTLSCGNRCIKNVSSCFADHIFVTNFFLFFALSCRVATVVHLIVTPTTVLSKSYARKKPKYRVNAKIEKLRLLVT
jgi:hypothetical protein